jgi:hypothetical protein
MKFLTHLTLVTLMALPVSPVRAADVDALLPAETETVMFVNFRQILDSELFTKYARGQIELALKGNDAQKMMQDLGLDPLKDIDHLVAGTWGTGPDDMKALFIVRGKFDPAKLFDALQVAIKKEPDKLEIVSEGKYKIVKFIPENQPKPVYASVASEKAIVIGTDKKLVANALADAERGAKAKIKRELADLLSKQDSKVSMFAIGLTEGKVELPPNFSLPVQGVDAEKLQKQLEGIKFAGLVMNVTDGLSLEISMGMKDAEIADDFGGTVDQLINTAKVFIPVLAAQQPQFQPIAQELGRTLKSKVDGKSVTITVKISGSTIGKVAGGSE